MPREHLRLGASAVLAAALHVGLVLLVLSLEEEDLFEDQRRVAVQLVEVPPPPAAPPEQEPEPEPEPPEPEPPPPEPIRKPLPTPQPADEVVEPVPAAEPNDAPDEVLPTDEPLTPPSAPAPPTPALPSGSDSPVRVKERAPSFMDRVLGAGDDPFGTGLKQLEGGLEYKADGPMSDGKRAEKLAKRMIEDELAEDAVGAGLVDDYFRELRTRVQTAWKPAKKELNDAGQHVTQLGFMRDMGQNPQAIGEMWEVYLDVAKQYARGEKPTIEKKRAARIRELFRSRKGNFRFHAITEVVVTQAAEGNILTIEVPLTSGHPGFDEGIRDAFVLAASLMQEKPPPRLSNGRPFRSTWRLRATWTMVPPTAFLSGNSFDISPNGVEVDVPFQIKLSSRVLLLGFDNRDYSIREQR